MRLLLALVMASCATGCTLHDQVPIKTQVVTFPEGAIVEFNGRPVGRAPAAVILPQDTNGRLTERTVLRALPNTAQPTLIAQTRILDPSGLTERVPDRLMIDLTLHETNAPLSQLQAGTIPVHSGPTNNRPFRIRTPDRGKPTQPVGLDRWNPGIY